MKKYILFFILLFIPFIVSAANVHIEEVTLIDNSEYLDAEENLEFKDLKISFNLTFTEVDEFAKYKVKVKNDTKKDYEIDDTTKFSDGEYIKYEFSYDGEKIVKSGETKEFFITVTYNKEVPEDLFENGKYTEKNMMDINLSNEEKNPYTSNYLSIAVIAIAFIAFIIFLQAQNKKNSLLIITLLLTALPFIVFAIEKITIEMNVNIEIQKVSTFIFNDICLDSSFIDGRSTVNNDGPSSVIEAYAPRELKFIEGMTFEEYMKSKFYNSLNYSLQEEIEDALSEKTKHGVLYTKMSFYTPELVNCLNNIEWADESLPEEEYDSLYEIALNQNDTCYSTYPATYNIKTSDTILKSENGFYKYECVEK